MRINLKLELNSNVIQHDYRRIIISYIKYALKKYKKDEYDKFYNKRIKKFCWALQLNKPEFLKETIQLENNMVLLTISAEELSDLIVLYNSLLDMKNKKYNYKDMSMKCISLDFSKSREITKNTVMLKTLSPICLREFREKENDKYVTPEEDNFEKELKRKLKDLHGEKYYKKIDSLKVNSESLRKIVVDSFGMKIQVSYGHLILNGDVELLNKTLSSGIGSKRGSGFGLLYLEEELNLDI